jgi:transposase-like protein
MTNYNTEIAELNAIKATLPRGSDGRIQFTNEFRKRVCALVMNPNKPMSESAILRGLHITQPTVFKWKRNLHKHSYSKEVAVSASRMQRAVSAVSALSTKREELMAEVVKIDQAIQLLKELGL